MRVREDIAFFESLYQGEYENIKKYVRRMVVDCNGIEDIVQETFYEAFRNRRKLMTHPNVAGWLRLTARNKVLKYEDKEKKYSLDHDYLLDLATDDHNQELDKYQLAECYSVIEKLLTKDELEMLKGYYEYGYSANELAEKWGLSVSNFKVRILRMKQRIKDSLLLPFMLGAADLILKAILFMGDK